LVFLSPDVNVFENWKRVGVSIRPIKTNPNALKAVFVLPEHEFAEHTVVPIAEHLLDLLREEGAEVDVIHQVFTDRMLFDWQAIASAYGWLLWEHKGTDMNELHPCHPPYICHSRPDRESVLQISNHPPSEYRQVGDDSCVGMT